MFKDIINIISTKIKIKQTAKYNKTNIFTLKDIHSAKFICSNNIELSRTVNYGMEKESLMAFLFFIKDTDVIWDIGASVGLYVIPSLKIAKEVLAFEPDLQTYNRLNQNIELNLSEKKSAKAYKLALGSREGEIELYSDGLKGNAPSTINLSRHTEHTMTKLTTIDTLIKNDFVPPTVLKIDIEGAEYDALLGAKNLLTSSLKPRLIFIEIHPEFLLKFNSNKEDVEKFILGCGYNIVGSQIRAKQYHIIAIKK